MITHLNRFAIGFSFACLCASLLCACGQGEENGSQNNSTGSGGYSATLVFPKDLPRIDTPAKALSGVDCAAAGIHKIEFNFILNGKQYGPHSFDCELGRASITTAPAGSGVIVEVFADDTKGDAILQGGETVDIAAGRETIGGEISMDYVQGYAAVPADVKNRFGMGFNLIQHGTFQMGSPPDEFGRNNDEGRETRHQVTLTEDFYMQATEMTQAQWAAVVQAARDAGIATTLESNPSYFTKCGPNCPVERVTYPMIEEFITILNQLEEYDYDLPSEAQWEYAARAESITALPTGNISATDCSLDNNLDPIGWYCHNSDVKYEGCYDSSPYGGPECAGTKRVGRLQPNGWGLYDMHGNVWEWVADSYNAFSSDHATDPRPDSDSPGSDRVLRGGSWFDFVQNCRSATRNHRAPGLRHNYYGFRLVRRP